MKEIHKILGYISNTKIAGEIPLDIVMHLFVAYIIMFTLLKLKVNHAKAYLIVFVLSISKEVFDSFSLTNTLLENFKDLAISMILPTILVLIAKSKQSERRRSRRQGN